MASRQLLERGYRVHATVRSLPREGGVRTKPASAGMTRGVRHGSLCTMVRAGSCPRAWSR